MSKEINYEKFEKQTEANGYVRFLVLVDDNAAVAKVNTSVGDYDFSATGSSKRNIGEPRDFARGRDLALARAFRELAASLEGAHPETP